MEPPDSAKEIDVPQFGMGVVLRLRDRSVLADLENSVSEQVHGTAERLPRG
ncbi:hypothetical protein [Streptomyces sp. NPDC000880]